MIRSIRTKLVLFFVVLAVVPMVGLGVAAYRSSLSSVMAVVEHRADEAAARAAADLIGRYRPRLGEVELLVRNQEVQDLYARYAQAGGAGVEELRPRLARYLAHFLTGPREAFARLSYLDDAGQLLCQYARTGEAGFGLHGYAWDYARQPLRVDPLPAGARRSVTFAVSPEQGAVLRVARAVPGAQGARVGVLLADIQIDRLLQDGPFTRSTSRSEYLALIDRQSGRFVYHPAPGLSGRTVDAVLSAEVMRHLASAEDSTGTITYTTDDVEWLLAYRHLAEPTWTVAAFSDASRFTAAPRRAGRRSLAIHLTTTLLALGLLLVIAQRITRSIRQVAAGAEAIAGGDLDQDITVTTHDETAVLASAFNRMAASLRGTLGELRQLTAQLEERVQERTADLEDAQRRLQEQYQALERANERIQETTRNKSEFLRRMSHDLRSPMNAIIGYTRLLLRKAADRLDEREQRNLRNIETSAGNLLDLINDILDLSRVEAGRVELHPQPVDLRALVTECADALEPIVKPGVELRRDLAAVPPVTTDADRLRQVVMNLLGNAAKFTETGHIALTLADGDGLAIVRVADTGIGIPPEDLPHVFDEFRQVERQGGEQTEGSGLGLSIARKTIELLGGTIEVDSEVGVGTTFSLRIGDYGPVDT